MKDSKFRKANCTRILTRKTAMEIVRENLTRIRAIPISQIKSERQAIFHLIDGDFLSFVLLAIENKASILAEANDRYRSVLSLFISLWEWMPTSSNWTLDCFLIVLGLSTKIDEVFVSTQVVVWWSPQKEGKVVFLWSRKTRLLLS